MNENQPSRIVLRGYKSIKECDLELRDLNILIGPNGAGKSNFIGFFRLLRHLLDEELQLYVSVQGGPDALLHFGRKATPEMGAEVYFGQSSYIFALAATQDNRMTFTKEEFYAPEGGGRRGTGAGNFEETVSKYLKDAKGSIRDVYERTVLPMRRWRVYHFHDTGDSAKVKQLHGINDNDYLRPDASNLAAFLYRLKRKHTKRYQQIVKTVRLAAPFFGDFHLRPHLENDEQIELEWVERGHDTPFKAHMLSDGTLRFICLATVLLQPSKLRPATILIDEPELGLHPYAIRLLASLLRQASAKRQIIVSTQSTDLLSEFETEDIVVVDLREGVSDLHRLDQEDLGEWLKEYSLGELWKKNVLGGRPQR